MSKIELLAKIELLNKYEAMVEEMKAQADTIRNEIKAEMEVRELEEMIAGHSTLSAIPPFFPIGLTPPLSRR